MFSKSLQFRTPKYRIYSHFYFPANPVHAAKEYDSGQIQDLWAWLYDELSDVANPERYKIPYTFAFDLTPEEHVLCEDQPDIVLDIIHGKDAILTWITPEIQWSEKFRIRYLQDYIKALKENGFADWADTIENLEGRSYLYNNWRE